MKRINEMLMGLYLKAVEPTKKCLKSERGGIGLIVGLIFGAIVILAVLGLDPTIRAFAVATWNRFATWLNGRLDTLFS